VEKLSYLQTLDEFYFLDTMGIRDTKEMIYYFQEGGKDNPTFLKGGIIMVSTEQEDNLPIFFYQNEKKERFFEPEEFPEWFLSIAKKAAKIYQARTRLRKMFKEEGK
jgi:hypothetical protein